jgi:hypothetical protein
VVEAQFGHVNELMNLLASVASTCLSYGLSAALWVST